jgi:tRNA-splicing ligase RtcB
MELVMSPTYLEIETAGRPIKAWVQGVAFDPGTQEQLRQTALLPFIHHHLAAMPDCHVGKGSTVGSVIPTQGAIIPAAVGVDIGCGMVAVRTSLKATDLPDHLGPVRDLFEQVVPVGQGDWATGPFAKMGLQRFRHRGEQRWKQLASDYQWLCEAYPAIEPPRIAPVSQVGTLGGGNHFVELCLDESDRVWIMLHSGSRGIGNRIGTWFIEAARQEITRQGLQVPNRDLAFLSEGTGLFGDYVRAVDWAQRYAYNNREVMLGNLVQALQESHLLPPFQLDMEVVNCHHNYIAQESHYGESVWVTRKGAIRAREGDYGIIPGSMGARSFIVRGKGNPESFHSCSHGAGRIMSRGEAKRRFTVTDHQQATAGIECRKDEGVIDETPGAYKDIQAVMAAQQDLVEIVHTLRQVVCVKG